MTALINFRLRVFLPEPKPVSCLLLYANVFLVIIARAVAAAAVDVVVFWFYRKTRKVNKLLALSGAYTRTPYTTKDCQLPGLFVHILITRL